MQPLTFLNFSLPIMITIVVSHWVADRIHKKHFDEFRRMINAQATPSGQPEQHRNTLVR
jgi:H+/Cl- antiporter ClcA